MYGQLMDQASCSLNQRNRAFSMFMLKAPLHDPDRREELPEGTSTLILRKVPAELNMSSVYMLLNRSAPGKLDFVYVPFNARKSTNISLAFVNFVDAGSAKKAYDFLQSVNTTMHWDIAVSAGNIQGFASNLAYYVARFGLSAISKPWAPLIFRDGKQVAEPEEIASVYASLPPALLKEAKSFVLAERAGMSFGDGRNRRTQQLVWKPSATLTAGLAGDADNRLDGCGLKGGWLGMGLPRADGPLEVLHGIEADSSESGGSCSSGCSADAKAAPSDEDRAGEHFRCDAELEEQVLLRILRKTAVGHWVFSV